jgi:hypothetical protein
MQIVLTDQQSQCRIASGVDASLAAVADTRWRIGFLAKEQEELMNLKTNVKAGEVILPQNYTQKSPTGLL